MKGGFTLERRVTLWSALVVALSLLTCGGGGAWFLYAQEVAQLDRRLQEVAQQFFEQLRLHGGPLFDLRNQHEVAEWLPAAVSETVVEVVKDGSVVFRSPRLGDLALPADASHFRFVQLPSGRMRTGTVASEGVTLRIAAPVHALDELLRNLAVVFSLGLPAMVAFVVLGGRSIARQALVPVRHIADSAEQVDSRQLDRRVPVPTPPDEIRRLALVLNATFDRLEASFLQAQRFSADASHELKTPLTALHAELETLLESPTLGEQDRAAVANALETAKRLAAITTGLLLLARADAGRLQLDLSSVDLVELLHDCLEDTRIIAEQLGLTVRTSLPDTARVQGEPTRLRQILGNLLSNAAKYNHPNGFIGVELQRAGPTWVLEIANSGPGIPADQQGFVFDRFFRAEHHAPVAGHGLGLAISRELARAHQGGLELVRSNATETVFRLTLATTPVA